MNNAVYKDLNANDCAEILVKSAEEGKTALIIAHRSPDGDAVGSAFALKKIYKAIGGTADCACSDSVPDYLKFLTGDEGDFLTTVNKEYGIIITVDTASPGQMGDLVDLCEKVCLAIDHHANCTPYSDAYRDGSAGAAGELIFKIYKTLIEKNKIGENADICRLIYAAISTDTGSFRYSNTTKETHTIASELIEKINTDSENMSTSELARLLHDSKTYAELNAQKMCIENLKICENGRVAYVILEKSKIEEMGLKEEYFGSSVDIPRGIAGVEVAFVIKESGKTDENGNKLYRLSTRSNNAVNVADICKKFDGGGHAKAAGGNVYAKTCELAEETVLREIINALKEADQWAEKIK